MNLTLPRPNVLNLKTRIAAVVLAVFIAGIWLMTMLVERRLERDMIALLEAQQFSTVSYIAADIEDKLHQRIDLMETNARLLGPALLADRAKLRAHLKTRLGLQALFQAGLVVISRDGSGLADYPPAPRREGASFADLEYFQQVLATGRTAIGKPRIGRFTQKPGVAIAAPVKDASGQVVAMLVGFATLSDASLFGQVERAHVGKSGWVVVNDPRYRLVVTSNDQDRALQALPPPGRNLLLDRFLSGHEGSGIALSQRGVEALVSARKIPSSGWVVQLALPTAEAFAPIRAMKTQSYAIAGLLTLVATLAIWVLIWYLLRPLDRATAIIREMAAGRQELHDLPVHGQDEIGKLLVSFNTLVVQRRAAEDALRESEQRAHQLAFFDGLTNLANRRMLLDRLGHALSQAKRFHRSLAVMFLDLDRFKQVNDTLGHDVGDELLIEVGKRLSACVRAGDTVSRSGGDEFVIVLQEIGRPEDAGVVAEKILAALREPVTLGERKLDVTTSIGISVYPVDGTDDVQEMMKKADIAMYAAKQAGRDRYRLYEAVAAEGEGQAS